MQSVYDITTAGFMVLYEELRRMRYGCDYDHLEDGSGNVSDSCLDSLNSSMKTKEAGTWSSTKAASGETSKKASSRSGGGDWTLRCN